MSSSRSKYKTTKPYYVILAGLITGTLDGIAALIISYPAEFSKTFRYIASGIFGEQAFNDENNMVWWGLLFHYLIATIICLMLLELHPKFKKITRKVYLLGIIYGLLIWVVMNYAVLPLTNIPKHPDAAHFDKIAAVKGIIALIICVGLPIAFIADKFYYKKALRSARRKVKGTGI